MLKLINVDVVDVGGIIFGKVVIDSVVVANWLAKEYVAILFIVFSPRIRKPRILLEPRPQRVSQK
tara:strand:- start:278 stop:472 length:195 start_codon:yes stop_codon:yes gene_type:complete